MMLLHYKLSLTTVVYSGLGKLVRRLNDNLYQNSAMKFENGGIENSSKNIIHKIAIHMK